LPSTDSRANEIPESNYKNLFSLPFGPFEVFNKEKLFEKKQNICFEDEIIFIEIKGLNCGFINKVGFEGEKYFNFVKLKVKIFEKSSENKKIEKDSLVRKLESQSHYLPLLNKNFIAYFLSN